jgi:hypothetical protein
MALKFSVKLWTEESLVERPEGASDDAYREIAEAKATTVQRVLTALGFPAGVSITSVDAPSLDETNEQLRLAHQTEAAGGALPSTKDIISSL